MHPDANREARARSLPAGHGSRTRRAWGCRCCSASPTSCARASSRSRPSSTSAIKEFGYEGTYTTVYPIKVNQQRHVVQEIVEFGAPHGVGLECGSKPELQAILGLNESTNHLIVCNGYKDEEFMRLALMGQKLGHTVMIVLEQLSELEVLLKVADEMGVQPTAGVRIKLATEGSGRWAKSGGERSKFGLGAVELMQAARPARAPRAGRTSSSWSTSISAARSPTSATSRRDSRRSAATTPSCASMGFDLTHVDVGGGLGVDYDGSRSTRPASVNYSMREYANDVVYTHRRGLPRPRGCPMPHLISESGRALTAHHSLLLINVIDVESQIEPVPPELRAGRPSAAGRDGGEPRAGSRADRIEEVFHDAVFAKERAQEYFASGVFSLRDKADADQLYLVTLNAIQHAMGEDKAAFPRSPRTSRRAGGPLLLQLLGLPVAARQLGDRPALSDHADPPAAARRPRGAARCRTSPAIPTG